MTRLNHHHLYIFWVYAKTESFTKAAQELLIAQSAVTLQIKQLENNLGLELINRKNRKSPQITNEGRRVLEYADSIFESTRELVNWATQGGLSKKRVIKIGALSGLSRNLQFEFVKPLLDNSEIKLEMITGDQNSLIKKLNIHELDIILSSHNVNQEGLYSHVLMQSNLVCVIKKELYKSGHDFFKYLNKFPLYLPGLNFEAKPELEAYLKKISIETRIAGEIDDIALLRIFALKSNAAVILPEIGVQNELKSGEVKVLHRIPKLSQKFYAVTKSKKISNKDVELLIEKINS